MSFANIAWSSHFMGLAGDISTSLHTAFTNLHTALVMQTKKEKQNNPTIYYFDGLFLARVDSRESAIRSNIMSNMRR